MTHCSHYDAIVVGSGPAGSTAALHLAQSGARVCVVERAELPRSKTCGGGVVGRAANMLPPQVEMSHARANRTAMLSFLDAGIQFTVCRERPILWTVMRPFRIIGRSASQKTWPLEQR